METKTTMDLSGMRKAYSNKHQVLLENDILADPFELFHRWFQLAGEKAPAYEETNAVCLSTATKDGFPSSRMVLLKAYDAVNGFTIFTNYESRKGKEIAENPNVALLFHWPYLSRQIRIEGRAERVPPHVSDEYFQSRPKMSRISARVSQQSCPIDSRDTLIQRHREEEQRFAETDFVPRPEFWGGFYIRPRRFEFWQGQSDRTHDRFIFEQKAAAFWDRFRIQP